VACAGDAGGDSAASGLRSERRTKGRAGDTNGGNPQPHPDGPQVVFPGNGVGGQLVKPGAFRAAGAHRRLYQALGAYRLTAFTASQVSLNIMMASTSHSITVSL